MMFMDVSMRGGDKLLLSDDTGKKKKLFRGYPDFSMNTPLFSRSQELTLSMKTGKWGKGKESQQISSGFMAMVWATERGL
jgi:hypothetical protein